MSITIREAKPGDGPALHRLVRELADHHDELDRVVSTPEALEAGLCSPSERDGCLIAECDGEPVGLITYMRTDSTNVSELAQNEARDYIKNIHGEEFLPEQPPKYTTRSKRAQESTQ